MTYTADEVDCANRHPSLGAEFEAANNIAERFLEHWKEEHATAFAEAIMKPVMDQMTETVWDAFRDYLLIDTEANLSGKMRSMVEGTVQALIGGEQWAFNKYIAPDAYRSEKVRETLAKLYADEIKDARIADLEKQVANLQESLRFCRG